MDGEFVRLERALSTSHAVAVGAWLGIVAVVVLAAAVVVPVVAMLWLAYAHDDIGLLDCTRADGINHRC